MTATVLRYCTAVRVDDDGDGHPCVRHAHVDDGHVDERGREWSTPDDLAVCRATLPYISQPKAGLGIRVVRFGRTVLVAGQPYTPGAALELSAAIARAATETTTREESRG